MDFSIIDIISLVAIIIISLTNLSWGNKILAYIPIALFAAAGEQIIDRFEDPNREPTYQSWSQDSREATKQAETIQAQESTQ